MSKHGRNDPCPCGSGLKYKKCCLSEERSNVQSLDARRLRKIENALESRIMSYMDGLYDDFAFWMARDEYLCWPDEQPDPERFRNEIAVGFLPWYLYNWEPELREFQDALEEDFSTAKLPPMETPARHFLRTQERRLSHDERACIERHCAAQFSFLRVLDVHRERGLDVEDMFTGERFFIQDVSASRMAFDGMIIFARAVEAADGTAIFSGVGTCVITPEHTEAVIELREHMQKGMASMADSFRAGDESAELPFMDMRKEYDLEIRGLYHDLVEQIRNPAPRVLQNTDGDLIEPYRLHYQLDCTTGQALEKLATLCRGASSEEVLAGFDPILDDSGEPALVEFPWLDKRLARSGQGHTVNGRLKLDGQQLVIEVNSCERADAIQRKITRRLGKRATLILREPLAQSTVLPSAEAMNGEDEQQALMNDPEMQEQLREMAERHWDTWLDERLPALRNQTPREAAGTATGRELLDALFDDFALRSDQLPEDGPTTLFKPPVGKLRKALGLA